MVKRWMAVLVCSTVLTGQGAAQVPMVNCAMFRNPYDRANCDAQNRAAMDAYRRERNSKYMDWGGRAVDKVVPFAAGRVAPGGGLAYKGGKALGNQLREGYDGKPPAALQPGFQPYYPYPFGPPPARYSAPPGYSVPPGY